MVFISKNWYNFKADIRIFVPLEATENGWKREKNILVPDWSEGPTLPEKLEDILQNEETTIDIDSDRDSTNSDTDSDSPEAYSSSEDEYYKL